jgi:hypothetical protein
MQGRKKNIRPALIFLFSEHRRASVAIKSKASNWTLMFRARISHFAIIAGVACVIAVLGCSGLFLADPVSFYSGVGILTRFGVMGGTPTIDPNAGSLSFALGARAAFDVLAGKLPLWNFYEGLGAPLLGEMQSAALFPPTWLLAFPHGQVIEHALLQGIGGIGAFLFFRKFGLGVTAAVAGAVLYELNGVFAWLRNAIFNPVAFLPWLLFSVECVRANALAVTSFRMRLPVICAGAVAGALALYAGFPEEVYLYAFLVGIWTVFRFWGFARSQLRDAGVDLAAIGLLSIALSAPVLVAFFGFLPDSDWGKHGGAGFYGVHLGWTETLQYFVPYVYGPIFGMPNPHVMGIWSGIGGYAGFLPLVAAFGAMFFAERRAAKIVLAVWALVCLSVTKGTPGIYEAFMILPLMKTAAVFRYLNTGWIFCEIFLAALFIDRLATLPQTVARRAVVFAVLISIAIVMVIAKFAMPLLSELWDDQSARRYLVVAAASVALLSSLAYFLTRRLQGERLARGFQF